MCAFTIENLGTVQDVATAFSFELTLLIVFRIRMLIGLHGPLIVWLAIMKATDAKCPEGTFSGVGHSDCYQLSSETAEYSQALADCIAMNGALPTLPNALTKSLLAAKAPDGGIWLLDSILNKNLVTGVWTIRWSDYSVSDLDHWAKSTRHISVALAKRYFRSVKRR